MGRLAKFNCLDDMYVDKLAECCIASLKRIGYQFNENVLVLRYALTMSSNFICIRSQPILTRKLQQFRLKINWLHKNLTFLEIWGNNNNLLLCSFIYGIRNTVFISTYNLPDMERKAANFTSFDVFASKSCQCCNIAPTKNWRHSICEHNSTSKIETFLKNSENLSSRIDL